MHRGRHKPTAYSGGGKMKSILLIIVPFLFGVLFSAGFYEFGNSTDTYFERTAKVVPKRSEVAAASDSTADSRLVEAHVAPPLATTDIIQQQNVDASVATGNGGEERWRQWLRDGRIDEAFRAECEAVFRGNDGGFSQAKQDWTMYHNLFAHQNREWGDGFFIDIGANDAMRLSNSVFFEKCMGWRGIAIEMQQNYVNGYKLRPLTKLVQRCVSRNGGNMIMHGSGTGAYVTFEEASAAASTAHSIQCTTLNGLLEEHNVSKVDFISMDIEGQEPYVLQCFDAHRFNVHALLIEIAHFSLPEITAVNLHLLRSGYAMTQIFMCPPVGMSSPAGTGELLDALYVRAPTPTLLVPSDGSYGKLPALSNWSNHPHRYKGRFMYEKSIEVAPGSALSYASHPCIDSQNPPWARSTGVN